MSKARHNLHKDALKRLKALIVILPRQSSLRKGFVFSMEGFALQNNALVISYKLLQQATTWAEVAVVLRAMKEWEENTGEVLAAKPAHLLYDIINDLEGVRHDFLMTT